MYVVKVRMNAKLAGDTSITYNIEASFTTENPPGKGDNLYKHKDFIEQVYDRFDTIKYVEIMSITKQKEELNR